jgi:phosphoribosyl 1,2-cyclic phosphodiesterase
VRIALLGSGSQGNVTLVEASEHARDAGGATKPTRLLVDAGLSRAEIERRLARVPQALKSGPLALDDVGAVLVTHEHNDHVGCAGALGRPLYAPAAARRAFGLTAERVIAGQRFTIGAFGVSPVLLPHDADETVGYVLDGDGARVGVLTDCGHDAPEVAEAYVGCDVLVLEANHDYDLLRLGPYPPSLKRRVSGSRGHLSNDQSAALLKAICRLGPPPRLVVAAHLSQPNNRPALAKSALDKALGRSGRVIVASQARGTPLIVVEAAPGARPGAATARVTVEPLHRE